MFDIEMDKNSFKFGRRWFAFEGNLNLVVLDISHGNDGTSLKSIGQI